MIREEEIRVDTGRALHGGDFTRMVHIPTGIKRYHPGPLRNVNCRELYQKWLTEIEAELREQGLLQYIVTDDPTNSTS